MFFATPPKYTCKDEGPNMTDIVLDVGRTESTCDLAFSSAVEAYSSWCENRVTRDAQSDDLVLFVKPKIFPDGGTGKSVVFQDSIAAAVFMHFWQAAQSEFDELNTDEQQSLAFQ